MFRSLLPIIRDIVLFLETGNRPALSQVRHLSAALSEPPPAVPLSPSLLKAIHHDLERLRRGEEISRHMQRGIADRLKTLQTVLRAPPDRNPILYDPWVASQGLHRLRDGWGPATPPPPPDQSRFGISERLQKLQRLIRSDFVALRKDWPSLVGKIPLLTQELERAFQGGEVVWCEGETGRAVYYLGDPVLISDDPSDEEIKEVDEDSYLAYVKWSQSFTLTSSPIAQKGGPELSYLESLLKQFGIRLRIATALPAEVILYLAALLEMTPPELLKTGYLRQLYLGKWRIGRGSLEERDTMGSFHEGDLILTRTLCLGPRRNIVPVFFHELGHTLGLRIDRAAAWDDSDTEGRPLLPYDRRIPRNIAAELERALNRLLNQQICYSLDCLGGRSANRRYALLNTSELLAEFHASFFLDGKGLRRDIRRFPTGSQTRRDYEYVFHQVKTWSFGGKEYSG